MRTNIIKAALYSVAAFIVFVSCNPAKQLQKQDAALDQLKGKWIFDWVQKNPCPAEPEINLDSLCAMYYKIQTMPSINDSLIKINPNYIFYNGNKVSYGDSIIADTAIWELKSAHIMRYIQRKDSIQRILVPYEDKRMLNLLRDSVRALQERNASLTGGATAKAEDCSTAIKAAKKWIWLFIAACVVIAGGIAWKIYGFFHGGGIISKII